MPIKLQTYDIEYLNHSWKWLNDPEIKRLTQTVNFTKADQMTWFKSLPDKKDYLIWGVEINDIACGVCGLKNITTTDCEYWGYIGEKQCWGKGYGKEMLMLMEAHASNLGKKSIWLKVSKENERAVSLYKNRAFLIESETENTYIMRKIL